MTSAETMFQGLSQAALPEAQKWAVVFDFDTDSCYPAPAVSTDGQMNEGLNVSGSVIGQCRELDQFRSANTYYRTASIAQNGSTYSVHMYALYFEKDQSVPNPPASLPGIAMYGHRHDWEYVLVWVKDGQFTHASFSAHGGIITIPKEQLYFDAGMPDHVKAVYHKAGGSTHAIRPAKPNELAENELGGWVTPTLVDWNQMCSSTVSNEQLRRSFNLCDFGFANCSFNDKNFPNEIAKNPPPGYPGANEWKWAGGQLTADPPAVPAGLVSRWLVLADRNADRDNREVNLLRGQTARIVVYLPVGFRENFRFTLKHDKHNANDQPRTQRIGHGDLVSGDAYDWPSFGNRIYLGDCDDTEKLGFQVAPNGFYVDLVLVG